MAVVLREVVGALVLVFVLGWIFVPLERWFGRRPRAPLLAKSRIVDVLHWTIGGPIGKGLGVALALVTILTWSPLAFVMRASGRLAPVAFRDLPLAARTAIALVLADLVAYGVHRLAHQPGFWRFHAVHHSAEDLDWLSAGRNHPLAESVGRAVGVIPFFVLGVDGEVLAGLAPVLGVWAVALHANLPWTLGPLRFVIATPRFHRWHHSRDPAARDKNFAGLFPVWDLVFGTFYMPLHEPTEFGADVTMPQTFLGQMLAPFRRRS